MDFAEYEIFFSTDWEMVLPVQHLTIVFVFVCVRFEVHRGKERQTSTPNQRRKRLAGKESGETENAKNFAFKRRVIFYIGDEE